MRIERHCKIYIAVNGRTKYPTTYCIAETVSAVNIQLLLVLSCSGKPLRQPYLEITALI
jgi:hypothetical protein